MPHSNIASFCLAALWYYVEGRILVSSLAPWGRRHALYAWVRADLWREGYRWAPLGRWRWRYAL